MNMHYLFSRALVLNRENSKVHSCRRGMNKTVMNGCSVGTYGSSSNGKSSSSFIRINRVLNNMQINHHHQMHQQLFKLQPRLYSSVSSMRASSPSPPSSWGGDDILFEDYGSSSGSSNRLMIVRLNRAKQLNALTMDMVLTLSNYLQVLQSRAKCVLVASTTPKAFCAGGDVVAVTKGDTAFIQRFFSNEYKLDYLTSKMSIPYISVLTGIVMGGGCGISLHGRYRICTDTTILAMPETTIGLIPDIGSTYILSRMKGLGLYLGLTGARLSARDIMKHGLGTHFIPLEQLESFENELKQCDFGADPFTEVEKVISKYSSVESANKIQPKLTEEMLGSIDEIFNNASSLMELIDKLRSRNDDFSKSTLESLESRCPLSLAVWFKQHKMGYSLSLLECLRMEFLLVQSFTLFDCNFKEGVRALLIDKTGKRPNWLPNKLEDVTDEQVQKMFDCNNGESLDNVIQM